jgi:hypothetical protein
LRSEKLLLLLQTAARGHNIYTPRWNNSRRADQLVFLNLIEISMWDDLAGAVELRQRAPIIKMKCNESHKTRIIGRLCVMYIAPLPIFFLLFSHTIERLRWKFFLEKPVRVNQVGECEMQPALYCIVL